MTDKEKINQLAKVIDRMLDQVSNGGLNKMPMSELNRLRRILDSIVE
jgi:hypothetical protein